MSKYQHWYDALIMRARHRRIPHNYVETHHIVPRALGGSDLHSNLVDLTYREHFLAHWLLTKIHRGKARTQMVMAFHAMTLSRGGRIIAGWQIEIVKRVLHRHSVRLPKTQNVQETALSPKSIGYEKLAKHSYELIKLVGYAPTKHQIKRLKHQISILKNRWQHLKSRQFCLKSRRFRHPYRKTRKGGMWRSIA